MATFKIEARNLREQLAFLEGKKSVWYGTFEKYAWRHFQGRFVGKTLLLKDIRDKNGNVLSDHLWFHMTRGFEKLGKLEKGQVLKFDARVQQYRKNRGMETDYRLAYPMNLPLVEEETLREEGQMVLA